MALLSSKFMRTLELVLDAALNFRRKRVAAETLAARQGYPIRYFEPILKALVKAQILTVMHGRAGGYRFSAEPEELNLADIEQVVSSTSVKKADSIPPTAVRANVTTPLFSGLAKRWTRHLRQITLADLCRRAMQRTNAGDMPGAPAQQSRPAAGYPIPNRGQAGPRADR